MAMIDTYDTIVVALGSMGSAAAHTLAARGLRVLGLETFWPAHDQGSAHGGSRSVRDFSVGVPPSGGSRLSAGRRNSNARPLTTVSTCLHFLLPLHQ